MSTTPQRGMDVAKRTSDVSWEYGDRVIFDLERGGQRIELESFGNGWLAWELDDGDNDDDGDEVGPAVAGRRVRPSGGGSPFSR